MKRTCRNVLGADVRNNPSLVDVMTSRDRRDYGATEQRIRLVANLIVEKIIEDGAFAKKLITILEDDKNVSK